MYLHKKTLFVVLRMQKACIIHDSDENIPPSIFNIF